MITIAFEKALRYSGSHNLRICQQVQQGSITKIYGPSGAGKTTALKIIAGLTAPDKGKISFGDELWLDTTLGVSLSSQKRKCGFVFQNYALFPNMTVLQHLRYATHDAAWAQRLLAFAKLEAFEQQKPGYLSGGQQQRLSIIRALAVKPRVLLMDEPFSALDPKMKNDIIAGLVNLIHELNTTAFIVTHNPLELDGIYDQEIYIGEDEPGS